MIDIVDTKTRSRMMASIRAKNTAPERVLRSALHRLGYRFRLHGTGLPGTPDIVLTRYRAVIFVHGCFWHRHANCRLAYLPKSRTEFWTEKFSATIRRDQAQSDLLREAGWRIAVVWECALRKDGGAAVARELSDWLSGQSSETEIGARGD